MQAKNNDLVGPGTHDPQKSWHAKFVSTQIEAPNIYIQKPLDFF